MKLYASGEDYLEAVLVLQNAYRMADAGLAESHVPGKINGANHAFFLLQHQHSL